MLRQKTTFYIVYLAVICPFVSCTKSAAPDIQGDPQVKFFTNVTSPGNAPQNAVVYGAVNVPNTAGSGLTNLSSTIPTTIKIPVFASLPVGKDVSISAQLDNSLITAYNTANNTNYAPFPAGILHTDNLVAHISKGTTTSSDSISIATDLTGLNGLTGQIYMAPIKLTTISDPAAGQITSNITTQVAYVIVNVEQRRIKYLATTTDIQGALITPRTAWTATFTPSTTTTASIFDGSTTTFSKWTTPVSPFGQLDVNMQTSANVTGIRLYTSSSSSFIPSKVDVYLSNDGINYDYIGSPLKANLTYASSYNYILFYKAIQAQYIRLGLYYSTSTSSNNGRVTEFDVYAQ